MAERIPTTEMNRRSGELIDRASRGESFELTRHGRVVARLLPPLEAVIKQENEAAERQYGKPTPPKKYPKPTGPRRRRAETVAPAKQSALEESRQTARAAQSARDALLRGSRR